MTEHERVIRRLQAQVEDLFRRLRPATSTPAGSTVGGTGTDVLVKLTSAASGGGWYNGVIWNVPATAPSGTSTLSEAQVGSTGTAILVCNLLEVTKGTHDIKFSGSPTPYQFIFTGMRVTCTDGTFFVAIEAMQWGC